MTEEINEINQSTPAERYADPDEVARVGRFLASNDASFMHGTAVDVDGGWLVDENNTCLVSISALSAETSV